MFMVDKQKNIEQASQDIVRSLQIYSKQILMRINRAMRQYMDTKELQMFDLAHFCEQEQLGARGESACSGLLDGGGDERGTFRTHVSEV